MKPYLTCFVFFAVCHAAVAVDLANSGTGDFDYQPPEPGTYALPVIKSAGNGEVIDSDGTPRRLEEFTRGKVTVLSFIYTRCAMAKACPYATGVLSELHRASAKDESLAASLRLVSLSFDPANDTPERMRAYAMLGSSRPSAAPWHFLTTRSGIELEPILAAYGQAVDKKSDPLDPTGPLNHTLRVYLVDAAGRIRNIYSSATLDKRLVLGDVKTLLLEAAPITPAQRRPVLTVTEPSQIRVTE